MKKERFFPEDHRDFCNGSLALAMDRFGGIEDLLWIDSLSWNGQLLPEQHSWQLFCRCGENLGRPFTSPAIRFVAERADGSERIRYPEYPEIHPSAVISKNYEMYLGQNLFSVKVTEDSEMDTSFVCAISKKHYECWDGLHMSEYNHLAHNYGWLPAQYRGKNYNDQLPFPDGPTNLTRQAPQFHENTLCYSIHAKGACFEKDIFLAFTASAPLTFQEDCNQWTLRSAASPAHTITFGFGIAENLQNALVLAQQAIAQHTENLNAHISPNRFPGKVSVSIEGMPEASDFAKIFPAYQQALVLAETERHAAIRAAFHKYAFFPIWDHIYPIRDFLISGEVATAKKALQIILDYPHVDITPFVLMHISIALDEYLAFQPDKALLDEFMPLLKRAYAFAKTLVNEETGLIRYGIDTAVDRMPELGLSHLFHASCVNGWWYDALCAMLNFALETNDTPFAAEMELMEKKVSASFEKIFYDEKLGYIRTAVGEHFEQMKKPVSLHTKSMGMDYVQGYWLFRRMRQPMSNYLMKRLHHPLGVSAVAYDSEAPAIYLKGTRMNQHIGHSCKMLRQANRMDGVRHLLSGYLYMFEQYQCAIETFNYSYCSGNQSQTADWQAFSATAAMQAILQGMAGLGWHRGGLFYQPADDDTSIKIANFHFNSHVYNLSVNGSGMWVSEMRLNGTNIQGTMQLPVDVHPKGKTIVWDITRTTASPSHPILLWAIDLPIARVQTAPGQLDFRTANETPCFSQLEIAVSGDVEVTANGKAIPFERSQDGSRIWMSGIWNPNVPIHVLQKNTNK